jgi:hypothetical protein
MASSSDPVTAAGAFVEGVRRVNRAPTVLLGLCAMTLLVALPLSLALRGMIEAHLGSSLEAEAVATATNYEWWQEFMAQATGLGTTFTPSMTGFGAVLDNLSGLLDNTPLAATIAGVTAAWMVLWSFLSGGVIDRLARVRKTRAHGFFSACGVHFWRFLRIGALAWACYALLFGWVHGWIFDRLYAWLIHDVTVERTAFLYRAAGYVVFGLLLLFINVIFDYARIRTVVEDRRSSVGAVAAGARFVRRHGRRVATLYAANGLAFIVLIGLYAALAPGAPRSGAGLWFTLLLGQTFIVGRHYLKLVFYGSQTALFQGVLAHARYTASPPVVWPDSPDAERLSHAEPLRLP